MLSFINRNRWGCALLICFGFAVWASFSAYDAQFFWPSIGAACGTLIAAILCFRYPVPPEPFRCTYSHGDWDFGDGFNFPTLAIPLSVHGMGLTPHVEFRQGDWVFPWEAEPNGDVVIFRDNHSIGVFQDLGVIIRHKPN